MCGIMGILSNRAKFLLEEDKQYFLNLMKMNEKRGQRGYSVTMINDLANIVIRKKNIPDAVTQQAVEKNTYYHILGHVKAPTGNINDNNFHPFETEKFLLAHNGIILNYKELRIQYKINEEIDVDTFVITQLLQKFYDGTKDVGKSIFELTRAIKGSYACFVIDKEKKDIYLFYNINPIYAKYSSDNKLFYFSSEMLDGFSKMTEGVLFKWNGELNRLGEFKIDNPYFTELEIN